MLLRFFYGTIKKIDAIVYFSLLKFCKTKKGLQTAIVCDPF